MFKIGDILKILYEKNILDSFNGSKKASPKMAMAGIEMVKAGLYNCLLPRGRLKYGDRYAFSFVTAVVDTIFSDLPSNTLERILIQSKEYLDNIHRFIDQEVKPNYKFKQIITDALMMKCRLYFDSNNESSEYDFLQHQAPIKRLNELGILIPGRETPELKSFILDATAFIASSKA
jgi:hypothetical protein